MAVLIIAEAGVNHNGDIVLAHKLIDAAKEAGADVVKFQTYDCEKLDPSGERREMLRKLQLTIDAHFVLKAHCDRIGIEFCSTPFDVESLHFLVKLGVKRIKIASGQDWLLPHATKTGLPIIISNGMGFGEICGGDVTTLHCTSGYPTPDNEVHLRAHPFGPDPWGLSDHTEGSVAAIGAVALGASVIEKHLTLDRTMKGPDHKASIEPKTFKRMVTDIRRMEVMLGDGVKRVMPSEAPALAIAKERAAWRAQLSLV